MVRTTALLGFGVFVSVVTPVQADDATPTAAERRLLTFLDQNQDDRIDAVERDRFPVPMRRWMGENAIDVSSGVPNSEFMPILRRMLSDLRAGQFSVGASRRFVAGSASSGRPRTGNGQPVKPQVFEPVKLSGYELLVAERTFTRLDKNPTDGKITRRELDDATKGLLESGGVVIPDEMDRDTFLQHSVRIQRQQLDQ